MAFFLFCRLLREKDAGRDAKQRGDTLEIPHLGNAITLGPAAASIVVVISAEKTPWEDKSQTALVLQKISAAVGQKDGGNLQMGKVGRLFRLNIVPICQSI